MFNITIIFDEIRANRNFLPTLGTAVFYVNFKKNAFALFHLSQFQLYNWNKRMLRNVRNQDYMLPRIQIHFEVQIS